jgi:O-antigen/teichoic acid export membrane protein
MLRNKILSNSLWYTAGNISYAGSAWLIVILITKYFELESVGNYALAFAISAPVFMLTNMRLRLVQTSDVNGDHEDFDYYNLRFMTSLFAVFVLAAYSILFVDNIYVRYILLSISCAKFFESLSDIIYGFFQKKDDLVDVGVSLILKSIVSVIITIYIISKDGNLLHITTGLIVSHVLVLIFYDLDIVLKKTENVFVSKLRVFFVGNRDKMKEILLLALPLCGVAFFSSLLPNMPKYFIAYYNGTSILGIYATLVYFSVASALIAASFGTPYLSKLAICYSECNKEKFINLFGKLIGTGFIIGALGAIIAYWFGDIIVTLVYGDKLVGHSDKLFLIMLAAAANHIVLYMVYVLTAMREFKAQLIISFAALLFLTIGCYVAVPGYGIIGAVIIEFLAALIQIFFYVLFARNKLLKNIKA